MSNTWGKHVKVTIFGESHGQAIGGVIDGLLPGITIDEEEIKIDMNRRRPGKNKVVSQRQEDDHVELITGIFQGKTTGAPLMFLIRNKDQQSKDYDPGILRPSSSDYTAKVKYKGYNDYRGGGMFSGRMTAPIVAAGAIAKQVLASKTNIFVGAQVLQVGALIDEKAPPIKEIARELRQKETAYFSDEFGADVERMVYEYKQEGNSIGGKIRAFAGGIPPGLGEPMMDSIESQIAHFMFSIPAVKAIEFGLGADFAKADGANYNDGFLMEDGKIKTATNYNGGILGGITTGMPLDVTLTFKPTPTIAIEQKTVDLEKNTVLSYGARGRHDPAIVLRAAAIVEAALAITLLDFYIGAGHE